MQIFNSLFFLQSAKDSHWPGFPFLSQRIALSGHLTLESAGRATMCPISRVFMADWRESKNVSMIALGRQRASISLPKDSVYPAHSQFGRYFGRRAMCTTRWANGAVSQCDVKVRLL